MLEYDNARAATTQDHGYNRDVADIIWTIILYFVDVFGKILRDRMHDSYYEICTPPKASRVIFPVGDDSTKLGNRGPR